MRVKPLNKADIAGFVPAVPARKSLVPTANGNKFAYLNQ
jgi:hypothetical protein